MIQDIFPKKLSIDYKDETITAGSRVFVFDGKQFFVTRTSEQQCEDVRLEIPTYEQVQLNEDEIELCAYLFAIDEENYFLVRLKTEAAEVRFKDLYNRFDAYAVHDIRRMQPKDVIMAAATAWHLHLWYRANKFCGACAYTMEHDKAERMMRCPECGNMVFPRIFPAVIVGVRNGNHIILTKYAGRIYKKYALIAGFTEIGESVEETVRREVMEEVGLKVKNITYYKSQPWGFDSNLLMGFFCDVDGSVDICMDKQELATAEWVHYSEVPDYGEHMSLTHEMMVTFKQEKELEQKEREV